MTEEYRYELFRSKGSSDKYGPCKICGEYVSDVYHQIESRRYWNQLKDKWGWTHHKCNSYFGHEDCLIKQRR